MKRGFQIVEDFENAVAEFTGAPYCISTNTGTSALFLALKLERITTAHQDITAPNGLVTVECPARTFISVPMMIKEAGFKLRLIDMAWRGSYELKPTTVVDAALRFKEGIFARDYDEHQLVCLSFHARKILGIGEGGAIITGSRQAADWLRAARYSGRRPPDYRVEDVATMGWQMYLTPEKAARGLHLMEYVHLKDCSDQVVEYPDLRQAPFFKEDV